MGFAPSAATATFGVAHAHCRGSGRLVGGDYFHTVVTNISARESRRRRYVAGLIHDDCALERLRAAARSVRSSTTYVGAPGGRALPTNTMVVGLLCLACVRISGQGTDRMDSTANGRIDNVFRSRNATRATIQNCARRLAYSRNRRHLSGSSVDPASWRVCYHRTWTPRRRQLVGHDGRSW